MVPKNWSAIDIELFRCWTSSRRRRHLSKLSLGTRT